MFDDKVGNFAIVMATPKVHKGFKYLSVGILVFVVLSALSLVFAEQVLVVRDEAHRANVIVVLSGEIQERASKAIELYELRFANKIIVSGKDNGALIQAALLHAGIPSENIYCEDSSLSTFENSQMTNIILKKMHATSIIIVTSWFHSRRAFATFSKYCPDIAIYSVVTQVKSLPVCCCNRKLLKSILFEYGKLVFYTVRYDIQPFM